MARGWRGPDPQVPEPRQGEQVVPPSNPKRIRNEHRSETAIGSFIEKAAEEASSRVARSVKGPPVTDSEAEILSGSPHVPAQVYTSVLLTDLESGDRERYRIVPEGKGVPADGAISVSSPLGRALLMEYPGAVVAAKTPGGTRLYRLLRVEE